VELVEEFEAMLVDQLDKVSVEVVRGVAEV